MVKQNTQGFKMRKKKKIKPLKKLNIQYSPEIRQTTYAKGKPPNKMQWIDDVNPEGDVKLRKIGETNFH